tara:strand:- start:529 stop:852 length:324 start_codon:yes stop_codon:yes gene_type:complete
VDVIAERLGLDGSTIFRELRRNHFKDAGMSKAVGYFGVVASMEATSRRQKERILMPHQELRELISERIEDGWTPEQNYSFITKAYFYDRHRAQLNERQAGKGNRTHV